MARDSGIRQYLNQRFLTAFGVGLVVIVIAVAWVLYIQRGAHIEPAGKILKVRTIPLDENSSLAVIDFRVENSSDYTVIVKEVTATVVDPGGKEPGGTLHEGATAAQMDTERLFKYYPILGQRFNDTLKMHDRIKPHETMDRMIAVRFEIPVAHLDARKRLKLKIEDVDGPSGELIETR